MIRRLLMSALRVFAASCVLVALAIALVATLVVLQGQRDEALPADSILVAGAGQHAGQPLPAYQQRLDHALALYRRQYARLIIVTGGVSAGESISEAAAARDYLVARGVPTELIVVEERSRTTIENVRFAAPLARDAGVTSVIVVTDATHLLRTLKMVRDHGFVAFGSPARPDQPLSTTYQAGYVLSESLKYWAYVLFGL